MQLSRKWQQSKPQLAELTTAVAQLQASVQRSHQGRAPHGVHAARELAAAARAPAQAALDAARQLQQAANESTHTGQLAGLEEFDPLQMELPLYDDSEAAGGAPAATDGSSGHAVAAEAVVGHMAAMQDLFAAMQQAATDVASTLQEHATRIRSAPPGHGALSAKAAANGYPNEFLMSSCSRSLRLLGFALHRCLSSAFSDAQAEWELWLQGAALATRWTRHASPLLKQSSSGQLQRSMAPRQKAERCQWPSMRGP